MQVQPLHTDAGRSRFHRLQAMRAIVWRELGKFVRQRGRLLQRLLLLLHGGRAVGRRSHGRGRWVVGDGHRLRQQLLELRHLSTERLRPHICLQLLRSGRVLLQHGEQRPHDSPLLLQVVGLLCRRLRIAL